ncbi:APC family permease [Hyphomicrobium sp. NDB2Meth4]|uniref:APC family permease n=1 Tax=Hyphomicrobium sp. NDB2Meth4 TaxID=1892846 RepID=UPI0009F8D070|nr:APC family permease [Hyphomicrobium sp. NDB2Meth4]
MSTTTNDHRPSQCAKPQPTPALQRQIGPVALLFTGITGIIGSGWLFASLYAAQIAGPAAIISWIIGGGVALLLSLVYAELGGMLPLAGAIARIPYFSHGSMSGFMAGWLCWIAYVATAPIEVTAVLQYTSNYLPWLTTLVDGNRVLTGHGLIVATALLLAFVILNLAGVRWLARANLAVTAWKLAIPLLAVVGLIVFGFDRTNFTDHGGFMPTGADGIFAAVAGGGVIFSLFGFRTVIDMAGEASNPQRNVPLAMIGAVVISLVIYVLLQIAFVGAVPSAHLAGGWTRLSENVADGPFAAFATILGLQGLAALLYVDAIVSPAGTGIAYTGATARINYALAENGQLPKLFMRLNAAAVPVWSITINFLVGLLLLLPLPGWSQLIGFISSAAILSLAFGPVSLAALRHQLPNHPRPFRLKAGLTISAIAFMFVGCIVYWAGWQTNWKVFALALVGGALLIALHYWGGEREKLDLKQSLWFWLFINGLGLFSLTGNYGGGLGLLPQYTDIAIVSAFSLAVFWIAIRDRLPDAETQALLNLAPSAAQ